MPYSGGLQVVGAPLARKSSAASGTARRPRTRRRRNSIVRVARRKEVSRSRLPMHGRNCFVFWRIFLPGGVRGAFTLQGLLLKAGRARSLQVRIATSVLVGRCEGRFSLAPGMPTRLELNLQADLDGPSISGTDERVPGHDIRGADCGAEAEGDDGSLFPPLEPFDAPYGFSMMG